MFKVALSRAGNGVKNSFLRTRDFLNKDRFSNNFSDRVRGLIKFWKAVTYTQISEIFLKCFFLWQTKPTLFTFFEPNVRMVTLLSVGAYFIIMCPLFLIVNTIDAYKQIMTLCSINRMSSSDGNISRVNEFRIALGVITSAFIIARIGSHGVFILVDIIGLMFKWVFYKRTLEYTESSITS